MKVSEANGTVVNGIHFHCRGVTHVRLEDVPRLLHHWIAMAGVFDRAAFETTGGLPTRHGAMRYSS